MAKFHINPSSGAVNRCTAIFKPCPYSEDLHFSSKEDALKHLDNTVGKLQQLKNEEERMVAYYEKYYNSFMDNNRVNEQLRDMVYSVIRPKMNSNKDYARVINSFLLNPLGEERSNEYGIESYYHDNKGFFINQMNEAEAEAVCDLADVMDITQDYNMEFATSKFNDELVQRMKNMKVCIEATRSLGIPIEEYSYMTQDGRSKDNIMFQKTTVDEYGEINNLYYIGQENRYHVDLEPSKVTAIRDGIIYTEDRPEGFKLQMAKHLNREENLSTNNTQSRAIFFFDESVAGAPYQFDSTPINDPTPIEYNYPEKEKSEEGSRLMGYRPSSYGNGRVDCVTMKSLQSKISKNPDRYVDILSYRTSKKYMTLDERKEKAKKKIAKWEEKYSL